MVLAPTLLEKAANPQGGMDPNLNDDTVKPPSSPVADDTAMGFVEKMAGLELRENSDRGDSKGINQLKIPAHQHDERKLFVGGLPTNGKFAGRSCCNLL